MAKIEKGEVRNPRGRPKGSANKATAELKDMILGALADAGGQGYLTEQAVSNPNAFLSLVGKVLPKDVNASVQGSVTINLINEFD